MTLTTGNIETIMVEACKSPLNHPIKLAIQGLIESELSELYDSKEAFAEECDVLRDGLDKMRKELEGLDDLQELIEGLDDLRECFNKLSSRIDAAERGKMETGECIYVVKLSKTKYASCKIDCEERTLGGGRVVYLVPGDKQTLADVRAEAGLKVAYSS